MDFVDTFLDDGTPIRDVASWLRRSGAEMGSIRSRFGKVDLPS